MAPGYPAGYQLERVLGQPRVRISIGYDVGVIRRVAGGVQKFRYPQVAMGRLRKWHEGQLRPVVWKVHP
jgi:hypothetical protein